MNKQFGAIIGMITVIALTGCQTLEIDIVNDSREARQ